MCKHVNAYRKRHGGNASFGRLQSALQCLFRHDDDQQARLRQSLCSPIVCLQCAAAFATCTQHREQHCRKSGHELAVNLRQEQLYCGACDAYVTDTYFDGACKAAHASAGFSSSEQQQLQDQDVSAAAMPVILERKWQEMGQNSQPPSKRLNANEDLQGTFTHITSNDGFVPGLRGLNNLGNTCFMNSILQVFLHVPHLKAYFLGGHHMHHLCPRQTRSDKPGNCLTCELDSIFAEAYGGVRRPLSPVRFLDTWWRNAEGSLAGYQQQDAHEFYLSLLDGLGHTSDKFTPSASGSPSPAPSILADAEAYQAVAKMASAPSLDAWSARIGKHGDHGTRNGIIDLRASSSSSSERSSQERGEEGIEQTMDRIFGGILRSDVVCASCGYTSTAHDPFKDISVDILEPAVAPPRPPVVGVPKPNPVSASKTHAKANRAVTKSKVSAKASKGGLGNKKRKAGASLDQDLVEAEPSETGLSEASALPGTTENSARCSTPDDQSSMAGQEPSEHDQTASSPPRSSAMQDPPVSQPLSNTQKHPFGSSSATAAVAGRKAKLKGKATTAGATATAEDSHQLQNGHDTAGDLPGDSAAEAAGHGIDRDEAELHDSEQGQGSKPGKGIVRNVVQLTPTAGVKKPQRCQKCYTCTHKQLKKQCLRNKALVSPTEKNLRDALQGGVDAAELASVLSPDVYTADGRNGKVSAAHALAPVQGGKRQKCQQQQHAQAQHLDGLMPAAGALALQACEPQQLSSQDFEPQHSWPPVSQQQDQDAPHLGHQYLDSCHSADTCPDAHGAGQNPDKVAGLDDAGPPPMPVRAKPDSRPATANALTNYAAHHREQQQQQQQQINHNQLKQVSHGLQQQAQQQQQQQLASGDRGAAQQAADRFQRSVRQQEVHAVPAGLGGRAGAVGLQGCLHRFVRPETLCKWTCSRCQCEQAATKQMSIRQLPPVLCLHMKRFKATEKGATKKVDSPISFPVVHLDMAPFTSAPVLASRYQLSSLVRNPSAEQGKDRLDSDQASASVPGSTMYNLHGVVRHKGNLLGGHYIGYVRCGQHWYQFDDARVTLVTEETVRLSHAYMLFYLQQ